MCPLLKTVQRLIELLTVVISLSLFWYISTCLDQAFHLIKGWFHGPMCSQHIYDRGKHYVPGRILCMRPFMCPSEASESYKLDPGA